LEDWNEKDIKALRDELEFYGLGIPPSLMENIQETPTPIAIDIVTPLETKKPKKPAKNNRKGFGSNGGESKFKKPRRRTNNKNQNERNSKLVHRCIICLLVCILGALLMNCHELSSGLRKTLRRFDEMEMRISHMCWKLQESGRHIDNLKDFLGKRLHHIDLELKQLLHNETNTKSQQDDMKFCYVGSPPPTMDFIHATRPEMKFEDVKHRSN